MFASERASGFPNPAIYDQYYINSYSLPKGLHCTRLEHKAKPSKGLYDLKQPTQRKGVAGWKLTRRQPSCVAGSLLPGIAVEGKKPKRKFKVRQDCDNRAETIAFGDVLTPPQITNINVGAMTTEGVETMRSAVQIPTVQESMNSPKESRGTGMSVPSQQQL